ncbi:MAG: aldo/keto reductase [Sphaerochaeta sp.]|nr:aldo/keto reductase [Sphaerochaeta sp.]
MQYKLLGNTDMRISALSLGTWAMGGGDSWGPSDEKTSIATIKKALDVGINFIDTAPAYGNGLSENILGRALSDSRNDYVLATKCGIVWGPDDEGSVHKSRDGVTIRRNLSPSSIRVQVEESLKRLDTGYIDLLITHWQSIEPFSTPIEETVSVLEELKREGKIRAYGASNVTLEQIREYQKYGNLSLVQERFSLLSRQNLDKALYCDQMNITFQAYSPLERGLLTGRVALDSEVIGTAKASIPWFQPEKRVQVLAMLDGLSEMGGRYGCSVGTLVIAWTLAQTMSMNVLCGARKSEHLEENALAASVHLAQEDLLRIDALAQQLL